MARARRDLIHFSCPRCLAHLTAGPTLGGTKQRCPRCHLVFSIPQKSQVRKPGESYAVHEGAGLPAAANEYTTFDCPTCYTRISARWDEAGLEMACPDCGTRVVVPAAPEARKSKSGQNVAVEGYGISDSAGTSASSPKAEPRYFPIHCPTCDTFMQVTEDQAGEKLVCPDCLRPFIVPPPPKRANKGPVVVPADGSEVYGVTEWKSEAVDADTEEPSLFGVECPLCYTRLHASDAQVGQSMTCPDCQRPFTVPPRPKSKRRKVAAERPSEEYGVGEAPEIRRFKPLFGNPRWQHEPEMVTAPPRWPFVSGVFTFPWYRRTWARWALLSLLVTLPLGLGAVILVFGPAANMDTGRMNLAVSIVVGGPSAVAALFWFTVASASLMAILVDTSYGYDEIQNWPTGLHHDWMTDGLFILSSLVQCGLIVMALAKFMAVTGVVIDYVLPGVFLVLFPFLLLSMVETNSPLDPISLPVWSSVFTRWWAWVAFYLVSTALIVGAVWIMVQVVSARPFLGVLLVGPLMVATLMIYFRLLGRLAWCCGETTMGEAEASDEDSPDNEDEDLGKAV